MKILSVLSKFPNFFLPEIEKTSFVAVCRNSKLLCCYWDSDEVNYESALLSPSPSMS